MTIEGPTELATRGTGDTTKDVRRRRPALWAVTICAVILITAAQRLALCQNPQTLEGGPPYRFSSQASLDEAIARLGKPATRMQALSALADFSNLTLYQIGSVHFLSGDRRIDALKKQAVEAILRHRDYDTVSRALDSEDPTLQFWGAWFWGGAFPAMRKRPNVWLALMPKVKRLAIVGDENVRYRAVQSLVWYPEAQSFLTWRLGVETDPFIVLNLLYYLKHPLGPDLSSAFTPYLLRLLSDRDASVRRDALAFIGSNHLSAQMWQVSFDPSVAARVTEMASSGPQDEKRAASAALEGMKEKPSPF